MRLSNFTPLSHFLVILAFVHGSSFANYEVTNTATPSHKRQGNFTHAGDYNDPTFCYNVVLGFIALNEDNKKTRAEAFQNQKGAEAHSKVIGIPTALKQDHLRLAEQAKKQVEFYDKHIVDVPADPREWTQDDLVKLATTNVGTPAFDALVFLRIAAYEKDKSDSFTKKAGTAQQALAQFTPKKYDDVKQNLLSFIADIDAADKLTERDQSRISFHAKTSPSAIPPSYSSRFK